MRKLGMDELNRLSVDEFRQSAKMPVVVVLDNIRSMHNVGSVFRTADAFLIQGIYLCGYTPLLRVSYGVRPFHKGVNAAEFLAEADAAMFVAKGARRA